MGCPSFASSWTRRVKSLRMVLTFGHSPIAPQAVFWWSTAVLFYTYLGYPILLLVMSRFRKRPVLRAVQSSSVSIVIAAYNEERDLKVKLQNTLALDYPKDKIEVIVASDCSTDRTDQIARSFASRGVHLVRQELRLGKTAAQNAAVEQAIGDILLFSDSTTLYSPDILRVILPNFADPTVGCVAGCLIYVDPAGSSIGRGARSYWGYESFLKRCESRVGSLVGVSGCLYAVRRSAYVPFPSEACSDFLIATTMVEQGLRAIYDPDAVCFEETNRWADEEFKMRVRIITRTLSDLWRHRLMMSPLRSGFYAVQLISHKVLRYLVPFFLIATLLTSMILAPFSTFYAIVSAGQICFYLAAALSWMLERTGKSIRKLALPQYFVLANLAAFVAFLKFLRGEKYSLWEPGRKPRTAATPPTPSYNKASQ